MDQKLKRNRGTNFTKEEELLLLSEVEKYKDIIECKMSDKISSSEKNEAWGKIFVGFNCRNVSRRNLDQIKIKYDNLKCKTRKVVAANKHYVMGTGGGPAVDLKLDPVIELVLKIINKTTVVGHGSRYDCDNSMDNDFEIFNEQSNILAGPQLVQVESQENLPPSEVSAVEYDIYQNEDVEISQQMDIQEAVVIASTENIDSKQSQKNKQGDRTSWEKYTPKKLKTPMSRRLRQTVNCPLKNEVYKKKIELIDSEIRKSRLEQEAITAKEARDIEEHKKKMSLMDIEIKLKERILYEN